MFGAPLACTTLTCVSGRDLERAVEELSELIEQPLDPEIVPELRQKVTDKTVSQRLRIHVPSINMALCRFTCRSAMRSCSKTLRGASTKTAGDGTAMSRASSRQKMTTRLSFDAVELTMIEPRHTILRTISLTGICDNVLYQVVTNLPFWCTQQCRVSSRRTLRISTHDRLDIIFCGIAMKSAQHQGYNTKGSGSKSDVRWIIWGSSEESQAD